ncbi:hypothetical protein E1B28_009560 [Marasmius oreades]|uniref:Uncharacterized protein n=1 Tax=Marasmius oreades TaxID=181124 RepID=A0A9P7RW05_9AGAR|nr:uncharacterized protein E1B28_009560 [Marasmius oreades]KAG7090442.1 hypothetical protein E1B28_009560 [Marasmius oreades]
MNQAEAESTPDATSKPHSSPHLSIMSASFMRAVGIPLHFYRTRSGICAIHLSLGMFISSSSSILLFSCTCFGLFSTWVVVDERFQVIPCGIPIVKLPANQPRGDESGEDISESPAFKALQ